MDEMGIFRSILKYEMLLHKIRVKFNPPDDVEKFYSEKDMMTAVYNVMVFHRNMMRKGLNGKSEYLKMYRNLIKIKIRGVKGRNVK